LNTIPAITNAMPTENHRPEPRKLQMPMTTRQENASALTPGLDIIARSSAAGTPIRKTSRASNNQEKLFLFTICLSSFYDARIGLRVLSIHLLDFRTCVCVKLIRRRSGQ
jgi:hypothetical protein